jgi:hypothetical protein
MAEAFNTKAQNPDKIVWCSIHPDTGKFEVHVSRDRVVMRITALMGYSVFEIQEGL